MRLKNIQVSGFKSFVDQTHVRFPGDLVGVVGPNGCGKSNVIDACRWVMGESSAKTLRGDSMTDVIFNGSTSRKPVGKVSVELVFDNSDGKAQGNYAKFAEIAIKRTLTRDGQSTYMINGVKTRRRDVLDLFRGTGLGPRSYSIIEQGMVSRIVEARPEDLRLFVEEAAGTSKYKERRRETENKIRHTRENLERITDVRNELQKQLQRLQRQANAAQKYKELKQQETQYSSQLMLLRLQELEQQLNAKERERAEFENNLESSVADQRRFERQIEELREKYSELSEQKSQVQERYYGMGSEIKTLEQKIDHVVETYQRQDQEIARLQHVCEEHKRQMQSEAVRLEEAQAQRKELIPSCEQLQALQEEAALQLEQSEQVYQQCLQELEEYNERSRAPTQQQMVQKTRIEQLQQQSQRLQERKQRLDTELAELKLTTESEQVQLLRQKVNQHDAATQEQETSYQQTEQAINHLREQIQQQNQQIADKRTELQDVVSRMNSLQQIQQAALSEEQEGLSQWLQANNLASNQTLAQQIKVKEGWERAADRVLRGYLTAHCVSPLSDDMLQQRPDLSFTVISRDKVDLHLADVSLGERLADKIDCQTADLRGLIGNVYIAQTLSQAREKQSQLSPGQLLVTRDGVVLGPNWMSFASTSQQETGVLVREEEIARLREAKMEFEERIDELNRLLNESYEQRDGLERQYVEQRQQLNQLRSETSALHNQLAREETRFNESVQRVNNIAQDIEEIEAQDLRNQELTQQAHAQLAQAEEMAANMAVEGEQLLARRNQLQQQVVDQREQLSQVREQRHQVAMQLQRLESSVDSMQDNRRRLEQQFEQTQQRLVELDEGRSNYGEVSQLKAQLEEKLALHLQIEDEFNQVKDVVGDIEAQIAYAEKSRVEVVQKVNQAREHLENYKLNMQEVRVRKQTQEEAFSNHGYIRDEILTNMPENANIEQWSLHVKEIQQKVERIGPVNLVAIDEYQEQSERKDYLDQQNDDLCAALDTLESVIRKIDRESRNKFKETFEALNKGFQEFFPRLFGGGSAELSLTSDDFLTAGVAVMARPPGKRNSTIHLLSGGEKALTAVALLFSLFKLNPAPFCMLDEVDAPLDDANVGRYCKTLRSLSEISQIIVITHNKITMEEADSLIGVTMAEPGVSRIVSVDIEQAVKMAG